MVKQQFETQMEFGATSLPEAILEAAKRQQRKIILQDATMQKVRYRRLILGAKMLASEWKQRLSSDAVGTPSATTPGDRIGVLLPNVNAMPVVLLSLWF